MPENSVNYAITSMQYIYVHVKFLPEEASKIDSHELNWLPPKVCVFAVGRPPDDDEGGNEINQGSLSALR